MLDVFLPSDKIPNGQVTLYDYLDSGEKVKNLRAKMWWANFFGIYHQSNQVVGENKYMDILDMIPRGFIAADKSVKLYSTLDHIFGKNQVCASNQMVITVGFLPS